MAAATQRRLHAQRRQAASVATHGVSERAARSPLSLTSPPWPAPSAPTRRTPRRRPRPAERGCSPPEHPPPAPRTRAWGTQRICCPSCDACVCARAAESAQRRMRDRMWRGVGMRRAQRRAPRARGEAETRERRAKQQRSCDGHACRRPMQCALFVSSTIVQSIKWEVTRARLSACSTGRTRHCFCAHPHSLQCITRTCSG
jgi:hypothetical protein